MIWNLAWSTLPRIAPVIALSTASVVTAAWCSSSSKTAEALPRALVAALDRFRACKPVRNLLGADLFEIIYVLKDYELFNYQSVLSSWEREHPLLWV
ncbi:hypothetical protein [Sphingorhabdus sp.]|jgi:glutamine synthetase|uniref:hypothetical protein n=1 Tax=Sphingorhabdus sp. TaxID=1902408 RepID=UPI0037CC4ED8